IDRISFRTIATSVDIQEGLRARGFKVVKDPRSVKSHVLAFADEIKDEIKIKLQKLRKTEKFSISLD
ncbi:Putative AC9 transposase, partial [Caligus rogercresseyi]